MDAKLYSVAIEIADGDAISTADVAREKRLNPATVFRWVMRGLPAEGGGRVRLEAIRFGRRIVTSRAALRRFYLALPTITPSELPASGVPSGTSRHRVDEAAAAKANLRATFRI